MDPPHGVSQEQFELLSAPLEREHVKQREQGGSKVSYIEGWHAINEANKIFGFGCWTRETLRLELVATKERTIGRQAKPGWGVTYLATVRIVVTLPNGNTITRDGSGAGHGIDVDLGQAHESALKEAETDAMKRALMTLGNPFGLALYDKQQKEVEGSPQGRPLTATAPRPQPPAAPRAASPEAPPPEPARQPVAVATTASAPAPARRRASPVERPTNTPPPVWRSSQPGDSEETF